jgi:hypothetical protein
MGALLIDNIDIQEQYGVVLLKDCYKNLFCYPKLKNVEINDWFEEDGIEVDFYAPQLEAQEITLNFGCNGGDMEGFWDLLKSTPLHTFVFPDIKMATINDFQLTLRLSSESNYRQIQTLSTFSLNFYNDNFTLLKAAGRWSLPPVILPATGWLLNEVDMNTYGIQVLQGAMVQVVSKSKVKEHLIISANNQNGNIADNGGSVKMESRKIKIPLYLYNNQCPTSTVGITYMGWFYCKWAKFFSDLIWPGERYLQTPYGNFLCYYESCQVDGISIRTTSAALKMTVELVITQYVSNEKNAILTENGNSPITENGQYT